MEHFLEFIANRMSVEKHRKSFANCQFIGMHCNGPALLVLIIICVYIHWLIDQLIYVYDNNNKKFSHK